MKYLAVQEVQYMLKNLPLPKNLEHELNSETNLAGISISDESADELRDLCTARLDTHGFGKNYELTDEGRILELLIDKLFIG